MHTPAGAPEPEKKERNPEVLEKIRALLEKFPELGSKQLYDRATRMDPTLHRIGLRSFHARYVLPIRRERARAEGRIRPRRPRKKAEPAPATPTPAAAAPAAERPAAPATDAARERVRAILLRYTREIAAAESRAALVDLIAGIDDVVREIMGAR